MGPKIIIVGAGIIGAMSAYHLSKRGARVTVIDAGLGGATAASFGWINASFFHDEHHYRIRAAGMAAYADLARDLDLPTMQQGSIVWEDEGNAFDAQLATLTALDADLRVIDGAEVARLEPNLAHPPSRAILFGAETAVDASALTASMLDAAQGLGAKVIRGVLVTGIENGVKTPLGHMTADKVLVTAGTGCERLLATVGVDLPMLDRPGLMLRTRPVAPVINHILASPTQELRQLADGSILAPVAANHQADTADHIATQPDVLADEAMTRVQAMLPGVDLSWDQVMLANRPMPQGGLPAVGAVGPAGTYVATMHSGVTLAAVMGGLIASEILDGVSNKTADLLAPYRPQRFENGAAG